MHLGAFALASPSGGGGSGLPAARNRKECHPEKGKPTKDLAPGAGPDSSIPTDTSAAFPLHCRGRKGFGEFAACADSPNPFIWKRPLPPGGDKPPPLWRGGSPPRIGHDPLITPFPHRRDGHWPSALRTAVLKNGRTSNARPYDWRRLPPSRRGEARPSRQHKSIGKKRVRRIRSMCGFAEPLRKGFGEFAACADSPNPFIWKRPLPPGGDKPPPLRRRGSPPPHRARSPDRAVPTP